MTTATNLEVANTILRQLGGRRFSVITGAKNFVGSADSLSFSLPGNPGYVKDGINCVRITLDPSDTYTVVFAKRRGSKLTVVAELTGVYDDMLQDVFSSRTGLATSLGTMGR